MKLSVIIPSFCSVNTLGQQLDALCQQQWPNWEVIVADNGSTDGTQDLAKQFADKLNLKVIDASQQSGVTYARNTGAAHADGDALLFIDDDDQVGIDWLKHMGEALLEHDFVAASLEYHKFNQGWVYHSRGRPQEKELSHYGELLFGFGGTLGIKRYVHEAIHGFDSRFPASGDMDYCWRAQAYGAELQFVPEAVVHYRFRNTFPKIYNQARGYAKTNVQLYRHYRDVHRDEEIFDRLKKPKVDIKKFVYLFLRYPLIQDDKERGAWMWNWGWQMGTIQGAWRYRVMPF